MNFLDSYLNTPDNILNFDKYHKPTTTSSLRYLNYNISFVG